MQNKLFTFQVLGVIAFALVLSHEDSSLFSHYGFFIVVSALCWIGALLIIFFHVIGCCKVKILGIWQREYSLVRDICSFNELCLPLLFLFYTNTFKFSYIHVQIVYQEISEIIYHLKKHHTSRINIYPNNVTFKT